MANNVLYYSDVCPDTKPLLSEINRLGVQFQGVNITESIPNLKEFLNIRDNEGVFDAKKSSQQIGIPVLITEDKEFIFTGDQLRDKFEQ